MPFEIGDIVRCGPSTYIVTDIDAEGGRVFVINQEDGHSAGWNRHVHFSLEYRADAAKIYGTKPEWY